MVLYNLKDKIKQSYNSDEDDILNEFLVPVLANAISYRRLAGYFSSNTLAIAARGISQFILNGGHMELIVSPRISKKDWEVMQNPESVISDLENEFLQSLEGLEQLAKNHLKMLGWMIKNDRLKIKFAILPDDFGMHHQKIGILEDDEGNMVTFKGSCNETQMGWINNIEDFEVFVSWVDEDKKRIDKHIERFERFWDGKGERMEVFPLQGINQRLIEIAPENEEEFKELSKKAAEELIRMNKERIRYPSRMKGRVELRPYQKNAKEAWFDNKGRGILRMATGTGKTPVAIKIIQEYLRLNSKPFVVVSVPTQLLVSQWKTVLESEGYSEVIEVMGSSKVWEERLNAAILKTNIGRTNEIIAVATYDALCSNKFINLVLKHKGSKLLVSDEMHHAFAPQFKKGLLEAYSHRLGLSATPERYMDDAGTAQLQDYFGGIIFDFGIAEAIPRYLVPYKYHAEVVSLTSNERDAYERLTKAIARKIAANDGDIEEALPLILKRAKIIINSESKWAAFERILDGLPDLKNTLIYCSDKQIERVKMMLHERRIFAHEVTYRQPLQHREEIIRLFNSGNYKVIVAMKVLDEGIDVPGIERAIILANSGNPIEYIQRRGRILRPDGKKTYAEIHDVLVFPWEKIPTYVSDADLSAMKKEMKRIKEFTSSAINPLEVMNKVSKYISVIDAR